MMRCVILAGGLIGCCAVASAQSFVLEFRQYDSQTAEVHKQLSARVGSAWGDGTNRLELTVTPTSVLFQVPELDLQTRGDVGLVFHRQQGAVASYTVSNINAGILGPTQYFGTLANIDAGATAITLEVTRTSGTPVIIPGGSGVARFTQRFQYSFAKQGKTCSGSVQASPITCECRNDLGTPTCSGGCTSKVERNYSIKSCEVKTLGPTR